jgi:membrane protease subunit HflC
MFMKRNLLILLSGALLALVVASMLFVFQVRQSEVAVVTTFGKPTRAVGPGPHFKWPWPVEKAYKIDERIQNFEDQFTEDLTGDGINLLTSAYVGWSITNAMEFFPTFREGSITAAQRMLDGILRSSKSSIVGQHPLSDFVNPDPKELKFDAIENEMRQLVQSQLMTNNCGIQIDFLGIKRLGLPESVTETVFTRMTSERNRLSKALEDQGDAEAAKIRAVANRQAAEMLANAQAEATRIRGEGEAEAARILPTFQRNPQLANFLLRIDALEQSLKERATLIFDERTPPFDLFRGAVTNVPAH